MSRRLFLFLALASLAAASGHAQSKRQNVREYLSEAIRSDEGLEPAEQERLVAALNARFADYGLQTVTSERKKALMAAQSAIVEGSFDQAPAERVADVAFSAYQAVGRGAPADVVQGIALYGYRKKVSADTISSWANGYQHMTSGKVAPEIAADVLRNALEKDWDSHTFDTLKWGMVDAAKRRFNMKDYATYVLGNMNQSPGSKPGALLIEANRYFKVLAKTGAKPKLPDYQGVFSPQSVIDGALRSVVKTPAARQAVQSLAAPLIKKIPGANRLPFPQARRQTPSRARSRPSPPADRELSEIAASRDFKELWPGVKGSAQSYLGTPYVWGGTTHQGIDCSALTQNSYGENKVKIPRVSRDQWKTGTPARTENLREGDLVFFNTMGSGVTHVGMVVSRREPLFIHASSSRGVMIADLRVRYYRARYLGGRRIVP